ncbi:MAG TPA: YgcG family protein [Burkholderiales bacterium]
MAARILHLLANAAAGLALLLGLAPALAQDVPVPPLRARVTDLTATLSAEQTAQLERKLTDFEARKGSQIAVLIVPTTRPESIEQYSIRVAEAWKLGRKGVDDGALLLVAKDDRELRIEVGYGLEGALTDLVSNRIVEDIIVPRFRQGDFHGGIEAGVDAMIKVVDGEPLPAPAPRGRTWVRGVGGNLETVLIVGFVLVFVIGGVLRAIFGRLPASALIAGAAGFIAWIIVSSLIAAAIVGVIAFLLSLLAGTQRMGRGGWHPGGFGGGGWSGGGGGWSGGGGWGGGGGGFGGGGASGRW